MQAPPTNDQDKALSLTETGRAPRCAVAQRQTQVTVSSVGAGQQHQV